MKKLLAALSCSAALGCGLETELPAVDPRAIDECEGLPALKLSASRDKTRTETSVTLFAQGGSGRYRYALAEGGSGGELRDNRLITGQTPGTDRVTVMDDCGGSARAEIAVSSSFAVAPARAEVRPNTGFALEIAGSLGTASCVARGLASGGSISENCQYLAGDAEGLDVITVHDAGSGDEVVVQYTVAKQAALHGSPALVALPAGASVTLRMAGGSDAQTFAKISGPGRFEGDVFRCDAADSGIAEIAVRDRFTEETTRMRVFVLQELAHTDKPHGRLSDQASLVSADFDGDGVVDVALGVPESDLAKPNGGAVFVWKGAEAGLPAAPTWTLTGDTDTASLGAALAAGDLDGDGKAELAVSEPGADITVADSGAVLIYTWRSQGPQPLRAALSGSGPSRFGSALAIADSDGDGDMDLLIGSPNGDLAPSSAIKERGVVDVFLLDGSGRVPDYASVRLGGVDLAADGQTKSTTGLHFGRALASGDFNADGRPDIASLGTVNNSLAGGLPLAKSQAAVAVYFGRASSPLYATSPDLYVLLLDAADGNEGSYRLLAGPAAHGGDAERLVIAADKLDAPDLSAQGGNKAAVDAGGLYVFDLVGQGELAGGDKPVQLGRSNAFARVYGDSAGGSAGRSVAFADVDGDGAIELVLGAPTASRPKSDKVSAAALMGKLLVYPYAALQPGSAVDKPSAVRWGEAAVDTLGVAVTSWPPGSTGLIALAGRASTELGNFTGRLDAYLGSAALAERPAIAVALPARVASQQRGAALQLLAAEGQVRVLAGAPGFAGLGSKSDGDDLGAGQTLLYTPGSGEVRVAHEGAATAHDAAYGGRLTGTDVTATDFDGDGTVELVVAAPQLATPTDMSQEYAELDASCVTAKAQNNGGAILLDAALTPRFRIFAVSDIAGCTPADDAKCKRRDLGKSGIVGGFDFDGDGRQDLMLTRANGLEVFLGREALALGGKPTMVCNPAFSLPALTQNVSAPAALGDLDADGCDEVAVRYSDNQRSGVLIAFGFAADGGRCAGHTTAAWLRLSGDTEVGVNNMLLGIASARAGHIFADDRAFIAISAGLYPYEGVRQNAVLLFDAAQLAKKRPAQGEGLVSALDPELAATPIVYRDRAPGFGRALAGDADLDGDGVVDLVVSAPTASLNGDGTGAVFAFRGGAAFGGRMDPWLSVVGDPNERANIGQDLSILGKTKDTAASLAIGAPLSYRTGTANGTVWYLQLTDATN